MAQMLVLGILVDIYLIILLLLLPFGYNCFYLIYCSWKYTPQISKHLEYSQMVTVQLSMCARLVRRNAPGSLIPSPLFTSQTILLLIHE
jgi:hypothetical protein